MVFGRLALGLVTSTTLAFAGGCKSTRSTPPDSGSSPAQAKKVTDAQRRRGNLLAYWLPVFTQDDLAVPTVDFSGTWTDSTGATPQTFVLEQSGMRATARLPENGSNTVWEGEVVGCVFFGRVPSDGAELVLKMTPDAREIVSAYRTEHGWLGPQRIYDLPEGQTPKPGNVRPEVPLPSLPPGENAHWLAIYTPADMEGPNADLSGDWIVERGWDKPGGRVRIDQSGDQVAATFAGWDGPGGGPSTGESCGASR